MLKMRDMAGMATWRERGVSNTTTAVGSTDESLPVRPDRSLRRAPAVSHTASRNSSVSSHDSGLEMIWVRYRLTPTGWTEEPLTASALVPNVRGAERAAACDVDEVNLVMSVSETHNRANMRMTREQSFSQLSEIIRMLRGTRTRVNVSLSTAFGCPMEGDIDETFMFDLMDRFATQGVASLTLCDTTGMAYPSQVGSIAARARQRFGGLELVMHFHNTRGMALANTLASLDAGIERFDASLGGLGGCPYAPGASGNACTEELVHMLDLMGYDTGISMEGILSAGALLPGLVDHETPSQIQKAGLRSKRHPAPSFS